MDDETSSTPRIKGSSLKKCSQVSAPVPVQLKEEDYSEPEEIYYNGKRVSDMSEKEAIAAIRAMYPQSDRPLKSH